MNTRPSSWPACRTITEPAVAVGASIREQLQWARSVLHSISCSCQLDSEVLLAHCLDKDRSYLFTWPERELDEAQQACFHELVRRRLSPEPVAYLVGHREFYAMQLTTTPATLVPRPETELLVDTALELMRSHTAQRVLELGTGTGAISLAIKRHNPACAITASDVSAAALQVARANAEKVALEIEFIESDWYQALDPAVRFDLIVSNPPYVAALDPCLSQGDLPAEPFAALCSGSSGLEALEVIIAGAGARLIPAGWLLLEHGPSQQQQVQSMMAAQGFVEITTLPDLNGLPRMTRGRSPG